MSDRRSGRRRVSNRSPTTPHGLKHLISSHDRARQAAHRAAAADAIPDRDRAHRDRVLAPNRTIDDADRDRPCADAAGAAQDDRDRGHFLRDRAPIRAIGHIVVVRTLEDVTTRDPARDRARIPILDVVIGEGACPSRL